MMGNNQELLRWQNETPNALEKTERSSELVEGDIYRPPVGVGAQEQRFFWKDAPMVLCPDGYTTVTIDEYFGKFAEFAMFKGCPCNLIFGDPQTAALYETQEPSFNVPSEFSSIELEATMEEGAVDTLLLLGHLTSNSTATPQPKISPPIRALKALATIGLIYKEFEKATIAMSVAKSSLGGAQWLTLSLPASQTSRGVDKTKEEQDLNLAASFKNAFEPLSLGRAATFACIAMLESGSVNIGSEGLEQVIAMSSGDSLYVATALLHDPGHQSHCQVTRIRGNIGRAGVTMLIPPSRNLRWSDVEDWKVVEHANFDSRSKDSFKGTSLHLGFTDYSLAIDTGKRGVRSSEVQLLETVVSVHDKGRWVADLDILPAFASPLLRRVHEQGTCCHLAKDLVESELIALDTWEEFLDRPSEDSVLRARRNWQARLAATALSVARGDLTILLGDQPCWTCCEEERRRLRHKHKATYIM
ncbi:hypothetical protein PG985_013587 [Apiospora marii]|uniref:uncharacterized protein n=1 Tax=Apiospora marii TaxID=335849 RepID=UPI003130AE78